MLIDAEKREHQPVNLNQSIADKAVGIINARNTRLPFFEPYLSHNHNGSTGKKQFALLWTFQQ